MLPRCLLSLLILSTAVHSGVLDSNVDCTIFLSCMDNEDCVRVTARRFDLEYCLDEDIPSIMEKRASSLRKILLSNLGSRMSGGKK